MFKIGDWVKTIDGWVGQVAYVGTNELLRPDIKAYRGHTQIPWDDSRPIKVRNKIRRLPIGFPHEPLSAAMFSEYSEGELTPYKLSVGDVVKYTRDFWDPTTRKAEIFHLTATITKIETDSYGLDHIADVTWITITFAPISFGSLFKDFDTLELIEVEAYEYLEKDYEKVNGGR